MRLILKPLNWGLFAGGLLFAGIFVTGCSSSPIDPVFSDNPMPATGDSPAETNPGANVARFHVGDTVTVALTGLPEQIEPHQEPIKEDGTITMPYIGHVQAAGKTAGEVQNEIYNLYVPKIYRHVTVTVNTGDRVYYVTGEVKQPGRQLYTGQMTVTKAISTCGDFTDFANHKKVWLIRASGQRIKVNCDKAIQDASQDPQVYPNDQIQVPRPNLVMIQFNILSGKKAGAQLAARHFPFRVGRKPGNELQLDDDGVWDQHLALEFDRRKGFTLVTAPNALVAVNGEPVQTAILRSGDIITVGSAKFQFWLAAARQRGLHVREAFVWALLIAVTAAQFGLIYWLLR